MRVTPKDYFMFLKESGMGDFNPYNQYDATVIAVSGIMPLKAFGENTTEMISRPGSGMVTLFYRDSASRIRTLSAEARIHAETELFSFLLTGKLKDTQAHADPVKDTIRFKIRDGLFAEVLPGRIKSRYQKIRDITGNATKYANGPALPAVFDLRGDFLRYMELKNAANQNNSSGRTAFPGFLT